MAKKKSSGLGIGNVAQGGKQLYKRWDSIFDTGAASTPSLLPAADATTEAIMASQPFGAAGSQALPVFGSTGTGTAGAAAGAASGAAEGTGTMAASTAGELIPALGQAYALFSLAKMGIQSGTYEHLFNKSASAMPSEYQRAVVNDAVARGLDQPESPVTTPDASHAIVSTDPRYQWNIPFVNGEYLSPFQMKKLAKGKTLGEGTGNPYWLDKESGQILSNSYAGVQQPQTQNIWNAPQQFQPTPNPAGMSGDLAAIRSGFQTDLGNQGLLAQQPQGQMYTGGTQGFDAQQGYGGGLLNPAKGGTQVSIADYKRQMQQQNQAIPPWMLIASGRQ